MSQLFCDDCTHVFTRRTEQQVGREGGASPVISQMTHAFRLPLDTFRASRHLSHLQTPFAPLDSFACATCDLHRDCFRKPRKRHG